MNVRVAEEDAERLKGPLEIRKVKESLALALENWPISAIIISFIVVIIIIVIIIIIIIIYYYYY